MSNVQSRHSTTICSWPTLKQTCERFIARHAAQVFASGAWIALEKYNNHLVVTTLMPIVEKKLCLL